MVVVGRAQIWLTGSKSLGNLYIVKTIGHAKALLQSRSFFHMLYLRRKYRAEQAVHLLVALLYQKNMVKNEKLALTRVV